MEDIKDKNIASPEMDADGYLKELFLAEGTEVIYSRKTMGDNTATDIYRIINTISKGGFANTYLVKKDGDDKLSVLKEFCVEGARRKPDNSLDMKYEQAWLDKFRREPERVLKLFKEGKGKATSVTDEMTFDEARKASRKEVGIGGTFDWKGDTYSNYTESEKKQLNLVKTLTPHFEWCGNHYYVMEEVQGISLYNFMAILKQNDKVDLKLVLWIMEQLAIAVRNIHEVNCIHQDLSPNNIMIESDDDEVLKVKIIDFGLATDLDRLRDGKTVLLTAGTPGFTDIDSGMYHANPGHEKLIDIYSMGANLYFMLFMDCSSKVNGYELRSELNNIHRNRDNWEFIKNRVNGNMANSHLLKECYNLIEAATAYRFEDRIQSAEEFLQRIKDIWNKDKNKSRLKKTLKKAAVATAVILLGHDIWEDFPVDGSSDDSPEFIDKLTDSDGLVAEGLSHLTDSDSVLRNLGHVSIKSMLSKKDLEGFDMPDFKSIEL